VGRREDTLLPFVEARPRAGRAVARLAAFVTLPAWLEQRHLSLVPSQMDLHFEYFSVRSDLRHVLGLDAERAPRAVAGSR
jgi:hypothetical protein